MNERATFMAARDATWEKIKARSEELKGLTSDLKFNNLAAIDAQIRELEHRQARTSMSLMDEKKILKEISNLQKSKKTLSSVAELKDSIERDKVIKNGLEKSVNEKNAELKVVNDRITAHKAVLDGLIKESNESQGMVPALRAKITDIRGKIQEKYDKIKAAKADFKTAEDQYYAFLNEERAKKREQEKKAAEDKKAAEEELKKQM